MIKKGLLLVFLLFMFMGCTKTAITGRYQLIMMNADEEMKLGVETSKEILSIIYIVAFNQQQYFTGKNKNR